MYLYLYWYWEWPTPLCSSSEIYLSTYKSVSQYIYLLFWQSVYVLVSQLRQKRVLKSRDFGFLDKIWAVSFCIQILCIGRILYWKNFECNSIVLEEVLAKPEAVSPFRSTYISILSNQCQGQGHCMRPESLIYLYF